MALSFADIQQAAARLRGHSVYTPVLNYPGLDADTQASVWLKPECLQRSGSFKFRGAYNALSQLTPDQRGNGVLAWSSGNHAQGVAAAAALLDINATIVMPQDAPQIKVRNTQTYGATVKFYQRDTQDREAVGRELAAQSGAIIIAPYDNYQVMAGQGTCGLEIAEQCQQQNIQLDALLVCCGGGGLTAGVATALRKLSPGTRIYAVEPEGFNDHARSLASGQRERNAEHSHSICDALLAPTPGELTFPINQRLLAGVLTVSDTQVRAAIRYAFTKLKLVVEPGGAVALAALLADSASAKPQFHNARVGVILSGGNIDPALFAQIIQSSGPES